jgi:cytochrome o ubiquinol oxidase subunit 2
MKTDGRSVRLLSLAAIFAATLALSGCQAVVLSPSGDVAVQQRDYLIESTVLMLLIILPVMALTVLFAFRYRHTNQKAVYEPNWDHSTQLELVIWGAPLIIIICLGALTWMGTHLLDPYRSLNRIDAARSDAAAQDSLKVDVVALDWKWLFIYPQYGVASLNELEAPVDRPITFKITSSSVMNSFYIPALAGQIYAMPGMETKLHAVINAPGEFEGFSANYSGAGFSGMRFKFHAVAARDFSAWIDAVHKNGGSLDRQAYHALERPSQNEPPRTFGAVDPALFDAVVNLCTDPGKMCLNEMMAIDAKGGLGLESARNVLALEYDKFRRRGSLFGPVPTGLVSLCADPKIAQTPQAAAPRMASAPVRGFGLPKPSWFKAQTPSAAALLSRHPTDS